MGERVSIQFAKLEKYGSSEPEQQKSVVLFNHWGLTEFPDFAFKWVKNFYGYTRQFVQPNFIDPISRFDIEILMPQLIMAMGRSNQFDHYNYEGVFTTNLYFGKDEFDGDNRDHGHHLIIVPNHNLPFDLDTSSCHYNPTDFTVHMHEVSD